MKSNFTAPIRIMRKQFLVFISLNMFLFWSIFLNRFDNLLSSKSTDQQCELKKIDLI